MWTDVRMGNQAKQINLIFQSIYKGFSFQYKFRGLQLMCFMHRHQKARHSLTKKVEMGKKKKTHQCALKRNEKKLKRSVLNRLLLDQSLQVFPFELAWEIERNDCKAWFSVMLAADSEISWGFKLITVILMSGT